MRQLPAFPLSIIAFPGEEVNLHIFEPRYRQLVQDLEENGNTFALVPILKDEVVSHATEMTLIRVEKKYEDGKSDIVTKAVGLLSVEDLTKTFPDKLYPGAQVLNLPWDEEADIGLNQQLIPLLEELYRLLAVENVPVESELAFRTYQVAHKVGFSMKQELEFLKISAEDERQQYLLSHLEQFLPRVRQMVDLKNKAELNGHFKHIKPSDLP
ncbi:MAG: LON peptidase substrate-binding domain-containing protein [Saprospiraceae bacterium]|nr:LON peptidase substrate-binding domain-containing protein [Saprospiraceae bacterium]